MSDADSAVPFVARRKDVAALAKVSPSTVSNVLNKTPGQRVSPETRQRIFDAANQLNYRPSALARALVTGKTKTIGVIYHYSETPFYQTAVNWLNGVWGALDQTEYRLLFARGSTEKPFAGLAFEGGVDGMLVLAPPHVPVDDEHEIEEVKRRRIPCVCLGSQFKETVGDYVDFPNFEVAKAMTKKLLDAGHKRILHIAGPIDISSSAQLRLAGYKQALADYGIAYDDKLVVYGDYTTEFDAATISMMCDRSKDFTALFAASVGMAYGAIVILEQHGRSVPDDLSVVAIDKPLYRRPVNYCMETYDQPELEIGALAARYLLERIEGSCSYGDFRNTCVDGVFVSGDSIRSI